MELLSYARDNRRPPISRHLRGCFDLCRGLPDAPAAWLDAAPIVQCKRGPGSRNPPVSLGFLYVASILIRALVARGEAALASPTCSSVQLCCRGVDEHEHEQGYGNGNNGPVDRVFCVFSNFPSIPFSGIFIMSMYLLFLFCSCSFGPSGLCAHI